MRRLAGELGLPFLGVVNPATVSEFPVLVFADEHGVSLQMTGKGAPGPVRAEFGSGKAGYRLEHGGGNGQLIARAVGLKKSRQSLHIFDATAGLGQDGFVLAGLGCQVTLMERSPVVHALLADGLARGQLNAVTKPVVARMSLLAADSTDWLASAEPEIADVIYLDPMFPHRDKTALAKKEMQVFRLVVGDDADASELLSAALERARYRVVVKRPRKAPEIAGHPPTTQVTGKSSRYDIYSLRALPA